VGLRIHTFGVFGIERGDSAILDSAWKTQKPKTLLKILLTYCGHAPPKGLLAGWIWSDLTPNASNRDLRVTASHLQDVLEPNLPPRAVYSLLPPAPVGRAAARRSHLRGGNNETERIPPWTSLQHARNSAGVKGR
jgi:hypothetical protein